MTSYFSVKNTAKNGRLIRAEIREYVLAIGLYWGFRRPRANAVMRFPDNEQRQKQYTEICAPFMKAPNPYITDHNLNMLPDWLIMTMTSYFSYEHWFSADADEKGILFYDTKKFTHYRDRLWYSQMRKTKLDKRTMQYMWTPALLCVLYSYCYSEGKLDLKEAWFVNNAENVADNMNEIVKYIKEVCHITGEITVNDTDILFDELSKKEIHELCINEALKIKKKLFVGNYIVFPDKEKSDLEGGYFKYGKKARKNTFNLRPYDPGRKNVKD